MTDVCPKLSERHLEREQHHDDRNESESEEDVASIILQNVNDSMDQLSPNDF